VPANQVPALEAWIDKQTSAGNDWIVIGDFNRRLDAALEKSKTARQDGRTIAMFPELNDDDPPGAKLYRVTWGRRQIEACREASVLFIDHIIFRGSMRARVDDEAFEQLPVAAELSRRDRAELSDHCPIRVPVRW
jgi:endonuclease/exonuclease/phosphatase family metal-dependent hydrolase